MADDARPDARPTVRPLVAAAADVAVLAVFVLLGRRTHHEDAGVGGFLRVLAPFLAGLVVGWAVSRCWRAPLAWSRAVVVWLATIGVGMLLRVTVDGRDLPAAFVVVALLFVGAGLLGWRAGVRAAARRGGRRAAA